MSRSAALRVLMCCALVTTMFTGCTRDPNLKKQKFFDSGEKYFAEGKYREAVIQYRNALQIDPRYAQAHSQLGEAYLRLGDASGAYSELNRAVELAPDNFAARLDLARILSSQRNPDGSPDQVPLKEAKLHLDVLKEKQSGISETYEAFALYYEALNDIPAAITAIQQAITLNPERSDYYLRLARLQLRTGLLEQTEANIKKAIQIDPKSMDAQLALGLFYQAHSRLPEAEQQFKHAIDITPQNIPARTDLVFVYMQQGKKDEAEAFLKQTKKDIPDNSEGYAMLGEFYFRTGDLEKAFAESESIYAQHPKDGRVKRNYIQLLILKNRLDDAAKLNSEVLKASPRDSDALVYQGQIQIRKNDAAGAVSSLQQAVNYDAGSAVAHYQLGLAFQLQRDTSRAEAEWREAVRLSPELTDAQLALANLEIQRGDKDAVLRIAQQIIATRPDVADGFYFKAKAEIAGQKYFEAAQDAEEARKRTPQSPTPLVLLGAIQLAQKHLSEAGKFFQQALDLDPSSSESLSGLMDTYFAQKDFDKAIATANAQIAKSPTTSNFYDLLGTAFFNGKKDYPAAEAALGKAVQLDKSNLDALEKLGKVQMLEGSADKALALWLQAIKDNPREAGLYVLAGELYEAKQNWDQAKAMYQQALSLSPDHPLASNNLAYVLLEQGGNVDVALGMAQTARRGMPDSPNAADTLGWAYYHKGIYQSAISQFQDALRLTQKVGAPDSAMLHYHLGLAYQKSNQTALARQHLEKAVKLDPKNADDARKALLELRG